MNVSSIYEIHIHPLHLFLICSSDARLPLEVTEISVDETNTEGENGKKETNDLYEQVAQSMQDRMNLVRQIMLEREACIRLRTQLRIKQESEAK